MLSIKLCESVLAIKYCNIRKATVCKQFTLKKILNLLFIYFCHSYACCKDVSWYELSVILALMLRFTIENLISIQKEYFIMETKNKYLQFLEHITM